MPDAGGMQALELFIRRFGICAPVRRKPSLEAEIRKSPGFLSGRRVPEIPDFAKDHHNHAGGNWAIRPWISCARMEEQSGAGGGRSGTIQKRLIEL